MQMKNSRISGKMGVARVFRGAIRQKLMKFKNKILNVSWYDME